MNMEIWLRILMAMGFALARELSSRKCHALARLLTIGTINDDRVFSTSLSHYDCMQVASGHVFLTTLIAVDSRFGATWLLESLMRVL